MSAADSPSVSSKNVCQELFLCKTVVFLQQLYQSIVQWGPLGLSTYPFGWWCIPLHLQHKKKDTGVTKCHIYQIVTKLQQILTTSATFLRINYKTTKKIR